VCHCFARCHIHAPLCVLDFFSPANIMKLLEVVRGADTSPEVIAACMQLGKKIKKQPVLAGKGSLESRL
jgi:3-hydroxyacyl-CoA dehydrogenase